MDPTMVRIGEAVALHHGEGQRAAARLRFAEIWAAAAGRLTDDRVAGAGVPMSVSALYPSLHLNLAECYRKLGRLDPAREHLEAARAGIGALGDDDYGRLIQDGLEQLTRQLLQE